MFAVRLANPKSITISDLWALPENADPLRDQWQPFDIGKLHNASLAKGGDVPPWPADYWTLWKPGGSAGCCTTSYTGLVSMPGSDELMMTYDMFSGCPESRHLNASSCYLIVSMKLHAEAAAHGPVERLKTDDDNSEWTDTTDGIHLFQLWGERGSLNAGKGPLGAHGTGIPLYDFLWGATTADLKLWHAANPRAKVSAYVPYSRSGLQDGIAVDGSVVPWFEELRKAPLRWWQQHHPEKVLYTCDRKTPAYMYGQGSAAKPDPCMPLDTSSAAVVDWQLRGADNFRSAAAIAAAGFDAIAADNYGLRNMFGACGVWRRPASGGAQVWEQKYTGELDDPAFVRDQLTWLRRFYAGVRALGLSLVPNFSLDNCGGGPCGGKAGPCKDFSAPGSGCDWDSPAILEIGNHTDGILEEAGFTNYSMQLSTGRQWESRIQFMANLQRHGKAYLGINYCKSVAHFRWHPASFPPCQRYVAGRGQARVVRSDEPERAQRQRQRSPDHAGAAGVCARIVPDGQELERRALVWARRMSSELSRRRVFLRWMALRPAQLLPAFRQGRPRPERRVAAAWRRGLGQELHGRNHSGQQRSGTRPDSDGTRGRGLAVHQRHRTWRAHGVAPPHNRSRSSVRARCRFHQNGRQQLGPDAAEHVGF